MKLKIAASKLNSNGCTAILENDDDEQIHVVSHENTDSPRTLCREAARKLRECADRFDALADSAEPYKEKTHKAINRLQVDNSVAKCA